MSVFHFAFIYNPYKKTKTLYALNKENASALDIFTFDRRESRSFSLTDEPLESLITSVKLKISAIESTEKSHYVQWVETIKSLIREKEAEKIVAARVFVENYSLKLEKMEMIIHRLIHALPNTFVYLYYLDDEIWLGASPELIGMTDNYIFKSISIAGTAVSSAASFSSKEYQEQKIVTDFMHKILVDYNQNVQMKPNYALEYGSISHLVNEFQVPLRHSNDFEELMDKIHPSPALSGFPKNVSIEKIMLLEPIKRSWYCGHAILKEAGEQFAFANIRCVRITENQLIFYAGAGITKDSIAENEFDETTNKISILKELILLD